MTIDANDSNECRFNELTASSRFIWLLLERIHNESYCIQIAIELYIFKFKLLLVLFENALLSYNELVWVWRWDCRGENTVNCCPVSTRSGLIDSVTDHTTSMQCMLQLKYDSVYDRVWVCVRVRLSVSLWQLQIGCRDIPTWNASSHSMITQPFKCIHQHIPHTPSSYNSLLVSVTITSTHTCMIISIWNVCCVCGNARS